MAAATVPERLVAAPREPASGSLLQEPLRRPRFVLLGGVPGAGKTTVLESLAASGHRARVLDPDRYRRRLAAVLPAGVPYRCYRLLVHLCATAVLLVLLLRGPSSGDLLVHDPATRRGRRSVTSRLARLQGWDPVLVVVDVPRTAALEGQVARRRVVAPRAFDRHWRRWERDRPRLLELSRREAGLGAWSAIHVVQRDAAVPAVADLLA